MWKNMTMVYVVLTVFILAFLKHADASMRCFECTRMYHPQDCQNVVTCSSLETCYVDQLITNDGQIRYTSGCIFKQKCQSGGRRSVFTEIENIRKPHQIKYIQEVSERTPERLARQNLNNVITCVECCNGELCNIEGCGTKATHVPSSSTTPVTTPDPAINCKLNGFIYDTATNLCLKYFVHPKLNWTDAQQYCKSHQSQLVVITGSQKIQDVLALYKSVGYTIPLWVGATDFGYGHVFTYTDGSKLFVDPSAGHDLKNSNCLYLTGGSYEGFDHCPNKHGFICERA